MKIGWALDMIGWACAQPFPTLATPLLYNNTYILVVKITKYNFSRLLKEAWEKAMVPTNIIAGFRNAGIYPFNTDKVQPTIENDR